MQAWFPENAGTAAMLSGWLRELPGLDGCHMTGQWAGGVGNPGAGNGWHFVGPGWGALAAVPDAAKGFPSVVLARALGAPGWAVLLAGPAAIPRYALPPFLRFQGGKGLGTTVGILQAWTSSGWEGPSAI